MEKLTISDNVKAVLSFRVPPQLKIQLAAEASNLGITLSDHCESIIMNRYSALGELMQLKKELNEKHQKIFAQALEFSTVNAVASEVKHLPVPADNAQLKPVGHLDELLDNPQLLELFKQLKGTEDRIPLSSGEKMDIIYRTPKDVLLGMIYSFSVTK